jgi:hypothetical protein
MLSSASLCAFSGQPLQKIREILAKSAKKAVTDVEEKKD